MEPSMNYWGKHLLIDAKAACPFRTTDKQHIRAFVNELLGTIEMVPLAPLWIEYCDTNDPAKVGISYVQVLQDSHSSAHFCDVTGDFYFDCFSCKDFDVEVVENLLVDWFNPESFHATVVFRDAENITKSTSYMVDVKY
ncbi:S-adenosylmethionine decarboxylase-like protein [Sinorhizobium phage phiN3]|uniref:S-adenosylmethionine decarboxylase-like protein n=1 Tax=Sinorhizobium phage phiN3 TaxID=1647405 RepID=A0A0F6WCU8_9CAUD|nr:S-adenosylmethionine decarboxylase [Sinorhizobium phage phiN3]AKF13430.2 S-adenosylmethionine decarboxylase-like protein [Sinorhizobium phage phiN3]